jgi:outer membrane lipoprotein SlyB
MNQPDPNTSRKRLHPLIATAAAAVIVASLAATAAITGVFPKASSTTEQNAQTQTGQMATTAMTASQPVVDSTQPAPAAQGEQVAQNTTPAVVPVQPPPAAQPAPGQATAPPPQYGQQPQQDAQQAPPAQAPCESCGTVEAISAVKHEGHGTGIGAVGGAVAGGLIGNQFGAGTGRAAMTVLGAVGGGFAGNSVEKHIRSTTSYSVRVHMENGKTRYFTYHDAPPFQQGERVRVENGTLVAA